MSRHTDGPRIGFWEMLAASLILRGPQLVRRRAAEYEAAKNAEKASEGLGLIEPRPVTPPLRSMSKEEFESARASYRERNKNKPSSSDMDE